MSVTSDLPAVNTRSYFMVQVLSVNGDVWLNTSMFPPTLDSGTTLEDVSYPVWYAYSVLLNLSGDSKYRVVRVTTQTTVALMPPTN